METQLAGTTYRNNDIVKEAVVENTRPNLRPIAEDVVDYTCNEMIQIKHPNAISRSYLDSKPGKERNPKLHASKLPIFVREVDKTSKREKITQEQAIIDGMSKMIKEMEDIKDEIRDIKAEISDIKSGVSGMKYRMRFIYGNRI